MVGAGLRGAGALFHLRATQYVGLQQELRDVRTDLAAWERAAEHGRRVEVGELGEPSEIFNVHQR